MDLITVSTLHMGESSICIEVKAQRCSGCKKCTRVCPNNLLKMHPVGMDELNAKKNLFFKRKRLKAVVENPSACTQCGLCIDVCRHKAIFFNNKEHENKTQNTIF